MESRCLQTELAEQDTLWEASNNNIYLTALKVPHTEDRGVQDEFPQRGYRNPPLVLIEEDFFLR
jgi:hypothetical protein